MSRDENAIEKEINDKGLNAPRLNPAHIDSQILSEHYGRASELYPMNQETAPLATTTVAMSCLTICVLVLKNGFTLIGKSAFVSPENFNADLGRRIARDDARNQIWALEGYALRSKLAAQ